MAVELEPKYALVVDIVQKRPGCALLQAAGGTGYGEILWMFDPKSWIVFPNDNLRVIAGTMEEWQRFAEYCNTLNFDG